MKLSYLEAEAAISKVSSFLHKIPGSPSFVFIGGATVPLHLTVEVPVSELRPTKDVDAVVAAKSYADYSAIGDELRRLGFTDDMDLPIRWHVEGIMVDVLPVCDIGHGMGNLWFPLALSHAVAKQLADGSTVMLAPPPVLLATKLEAFNDRGRKDPLASHDLEDIITLIDGRPELPDEVKAMPEELVRYVAQNCQGILELPDFLIILEGNLSHTRHGDQRIAAVVARLRALTKL